MPSSTARNTAITSTFIFLSWLFFFMPLLCSAAGNTAAEYGTVLNLAGKQRMLTQKMSKEILLIALREDQDGNLKNLTATSKLFDKTLKGLKGGDKDLRLPPTASSRILKQLDKIDSKYWQNFHGVVKTILKTGSVDAQQVADIAAANLPLLKEMNKCVKLYEKDAGKAGLKSNPGLAVTINLAGKQRMLTQKMSKEFLLTAFGYQIEDNKLNLLETATLFERTLQGLMDGDAALDLPGTQNEVIRKQLMTVQKLWQNFKPFIEAATDPNTTQISKEQITELAGANLPLLKEMNKAVGMFEKEAAK